MSTAGALRQDMVQPTRRTAVTPHPDGAAVRAEGLRRQFNGTTAVEGLGLEVTKGEIYGFLGPNGAGKSTTVRMLCTLLAPTGGRATVAGYDVATNPGAVRLRIGAALQEVALDPKQTGAELLRLQGLLYGLNRRDLDRRGGEARGAHGSRDAPRPGRGPPPRRG